MRQATQPTQQDGYVAIAIVLILSVVILGMVVTVSQLGIGEGQASLANSNGTISLNLTEGCMEDALLNLRASASYAGGTITRPEGSCTITVVNASPTYTLTATAVATGSVYQRKIQTVVSRSSSAITITSWKEQ